MKIKDVITENDNRSQGSGIAANSKEAKKMHDNAQSSKAGTNFNARDALAKVRSMYGVTLVDDFLGVFDDKQPGSSTATDGEDSLLTKDNRDE